MNEHTYSREVSAHKKLAQKSGDPEPRWLEGNVRVVTHMQFLKYEEEPYDTSNVGQTKKELYRWSTYKDGLLSSYLKVFMCIKRRQLCVLHIDF